MSDILSPPVVIDACTDTCKAMKLISKQLIMFSSIYTKTPPSSNDSELGGIFTEIIKNVSNIQDLVTKLAKSTKKDLGEKSRIEFPKNIILTHKEYLILYNVFIRYTEDN